VRKKREGGGWGGFLFLGGKGRPKTKKKTGEPETGATLVQEFG